MMTASVTSALPIIFDNNIPYADAPSDNNSLSWAVSLTTLLPLLDKAFEFNAIYDHLIGPSTLVFESYRILTEIVISKMSALTS